MTSLSEPVSISPAPSEYHSRAPELHGFVAWTSSSLLCLVYILWALLPDEYIVWAGVEWYPNREWSLLIPAWSMDMVLLTYFAYMALTIHCTPAFHDISAVTGGHSDSKAQFPFEDDPSHSIYDWKAFFSIYALYTQSERNTKLELYDLPLELVNRVLYTQDTPTS
ncbi:PIG-P [Lentinula raphanica]|nr:PIG-P [Lentinula raphanica]